MWAITETICAQDSASSINDWSRNMQHSMNGGTQPQAQGYFKCAIASRPALSKDCCSRTLCLFHPRTVQSLNSSFCESGSPPSGTKLNTHTVKNLGVNVMRENKLNDDIRCWSRSKVLLPSGFLPNARQRHREQQK